jgi:hypothetical protein
MQGLSQAQLANRADAILARNLLDADMASADSAYASMTQKQDVKADPIYLENLNFSHQMSLESYKNQNAMQKANWDYANDLEKQLWASKLKTDVEPGKFEKSLGLLNSSVASAVNSITSWLDGEEEDSDTADSNSGSRRKTPEQLKYEADLRENAQKQKSLKENELEYYIHQLRGHSSAQVWQAMGEEKMASLGFTDRNQLLYLDSQEQQINEAKQLYAAKESGQQLSQSDEFRANAYAMGWGADVQSYSQHLNEWGPYIKTAPLAKVAAGQSGTASTTQAATGQQQTQQQAQQQVQQQAQQQTQQSSQAATSNVTVPRDSSATATNYVEVPKADSTVTAQTTNPVSSELPTDSTGNATSLNMPSITQVPETLSQSKVQIPSTGISEELQQQMQQQAYFAENQQAADQVANAMLGGAEDYLKVMTGAKGVPDKYKDDIIANIKAYLAGTVTEETSILGAVTPYAITNLEENETLAAKVNPTSTQERWSDHTSHVIDSNKIENENENNRLSNGYQSTSAEDQYSKSNKKIILNNIQGFALPNELLAIVGPSGCGKTSLLNILG